MHPDFWQQRWAAGQIGFHQSTPTPLLQKHWSTLQLPAGARVLGFNYDTGERYLSVEGFLPTA